METYRGASLVEGLKMALYRHSQARQASVREYARVVLQHIFVRAPPGRLPHSCVRTLIINWQDQAALPRNSGLVRTSSKHTVTRQLLAGALEALCHRATRGFPHIGNYTGDLHMKRGIEFCLMTEGYWAKSSFEPHIAKARHSRSARSV